MQDVLNMSFREVCQANRNLWSWLKSQPTLDKSDFAFTFSLDIYSFSGDFGESIVDVQCVRWFTLCKALVVKWETRNQLVIDNCLEFDICDNVLGHPTNSSPSNYDCVACEWYRAKSITCTCSWESQLSIEGSQYFPALTIQSIQMFLLEGLKPNTANLWLVPMLHVFSKAQHISSSLV